MANQLPDSGDLVTVAVGAYWDVRKTQAERSHALGIIGANLPRAVQRWRHNLAGRGGEQGYARVSAGNVPASRRGALADQVVAAPGIRTTVVQSQPFSVPLKRRWVSIVSLAEADESSSTGRIVLRGGAFSADHGMAEPQDLVRTSNVDGLLGRGFELVTDPLSDGRHMLTLTAPHGAGGFASASTSVVVTRNLSSELAAPVHGVERWLRLVLSVSAMGGAGAPLSGPRLVYPLSTEGRRVPARPDRPLRWQNAVRRDRDPGWFPSPSRRARTASL